MVGGPLTEKDFDLFDLVERWGGQVVLDATEGGTRMLPAHFDPAGWPRTRSPNSPGRTSTAVPDVFRRPNDALFAWLGRQLAAEGVRGVLFRRYVWCDLWHAELYRFRQWSPVPVLEIDVHHDDEGDCADRRPRGGVSGNAAMNDLPRRITMREWDDRYSELRAAGLREPDYGGPLRRHVDQGGNRRLLCLRLDNSPAALRLWNFLLTEEERLRQAESRGQKLVGTMKDLGTVPVMAYALPNLVAFYPDGAWWLPCLMEDRTQLLAIADSLGIDESFCPVRAMLGAFVGRAHFPIPGLLTCSVGATCDDFSAIAQRLAGLGHDVVWWEMPHRRRPEAGEPGVELPGGFVAPRLQVDFVRQELERLRETLAAYAGRPLADEMLAAGIRRANRFRRELGHLRRLVFTAPECPLPALEMLVAEMLALHFCSDQAEALAVVQSLRAEVERRVAAGMGVVSPGAVRIYWVNPVADLRAMNLLEDLGGRVCGSECLFCHAIEPIPEDLDPLEALARAALADPMVGSPVDRAERIGARSRRWGRGPGHFADPRGQPLRLGRVDHRLRGARALRGAGRGNRSAAALRLDRAFAAHAAGGLAGNGPREPEIEHGQHRHDLRGHRRRLAGDQGGFVGSPADARAGRGRGGPRSRPRVAGAGTPRRAALRMRHRPRRLGAVVATGYGRKLIRLADQAITEITCQAWGVRQRSPAARTIIDIGGQDSKVLRLAVDGSIDDFVMNDRCAAGSGRFLEVLADRLAVDLPSLGQLARASRQPAGISSMCVVFAETEIVGLLASGTLPEDIVAGVETSVARRIAAMVGQHPPAPIILTGGVALIPGMDSALSAALGAEVVVSPDPQLTGALGAAVLASRRLDGKHTPAL